METVMKAYGYLRVSGLTQVEGDGFTRQEQAIKAYAETHGIDIVSIYREEGVSGKSELQDRDALQAMLLDAETTGVCLVLIERVDRLARDLMVQETIIGDFRKRGIELVSTAEPDLCSTDPTRVLMRQIMGAIAQYDRAMLVAKLASARKRIRNKGVRCDGRKAYGFREGEEAVIMRMGTMRASGMPWATIAEQLNAEGTMSRAGRWHANSVRRTVLASGSAVPTGS